MMTKIPPTLGLVLAGGQAQRMGGGDKAFLQVGGKTMLERVLARLAPCSPILLNANGDPARFSRYGLEVIADSVPDSAGPLAGILAGLDWAAKNARQIEWMASAPGDCPFLPMDLVPRLHAARIAEKKPLASVRSGNRTHPVVGLWPVALREDLRRALTVEDVHKVDAWTRRHGVALAEWPDQPVDLFFNVNTSEDLAKADEIAAKNSL